MTPAPQDGGAAPARSAESGVDGAGRSGGDGAGRLLVVATPIGNLGDAGVRLADVLRSVDVIACEDTRRTRTLLSALDAAGARLVSYRSDNESASAAGIVALLLRGDTVALVSDAGTPAIADPGVELVRAAHEAGIEVIAVPGPSAVAAAVSVSGFGATRFTFVGFLSRSARLLCDFVEEHPHEVLVAYESPKRTARSLEAIASVQPQRRVSVSRELSKLHEQTRTGRADTIAAELAADPPRGEVVIVLDALPTTAEVGVNQRTLALARALVEEGVRMKDACRIATAHDGGSSRELYAAMLAEG